MKQPMDAKDNCKICRDGIIRNLPFLGQGWIQCWRWWLPISFYCYMASLLDNTQLVTNYALPAVVWIYHQNEGDIIGKALYNYTVIFEWVSSELIIVCVDRRHKHKKRTAFSNEHGWWQYQLHVPAGINWLFLCWMPCKPPVSRWNGSSWHFPLKSHMTCN